VRALVNTVPRDVHARVLDAGEQLVVGQAVEAQLVEPLAMCTEV